MILRIHMRAHAVLHALVFFLFASGVADAAEPRIRGAGQVLMGEGVSRIVVGKTPRIPVFDKNGRLRMMPLRADVPLFVFEEDKAGRLLVFRRQERAAAVPADVWADKANCFPWNTRLLLYPKSDGRIARLTRIALGEDKRFPRFNVKQPLPGWPIAVRASKDANLDTICNLSQFGGRITNISVADASDFEILAFFSHDDLILIEMALINLQGQIEAPGEIPNWPFYLTQLARVLDYDFLDVSVMTNAARNCPKPGETLDEVGVQRFNASLKQVQKWASDQGRDLDRIRKDEYRYTEQVKQLVKLPGEPKPIENVIEHTTYVVPISQVPNNMRKRLWSR